jgi:hypothetical protein
MQRQARGVEGSRCVRLVGAADQSLFAQINLLASDAEREESLLQVADFGIRLPRIPGVLIGRSGRPGLVEDARILRLSDHLQPPRGLNLHIKSGALEQIEVFVVRLEAPVLEAKLCLKSVKTQADKALE